MIIRRIIDNKEIVKVVSIHENAFPGFFLTTLGFHFLKIYYRSVLKHKDGILLGCFSENNKLYGFCAATKISKNFNKKIVKENIMQFTLISLRLLFSKPTSLIRLKNNFTKKNSVVIDNVEYAELLSIAVSVKNQRRGIGEKLLLQLENELKYEACKNLSLTTDYFNNEKTIDFYKKIGYNVLYDFVSYPERRMYRMIKNLE